MGQRANLLVVENGKYELYYNHWAGNSLDCYLFWGPQPTLTYIRSHDQDNSQWLDTIWCEGAALLDLDKRELLWFGGEDIRYDIPLRRTLLQLMQPMWPGYRIRWAYRGIIDIANHVGIDSRALIARVERPCSDEKLTRSLTPCPVEDCAAIFSLVRNGRTSVYAMPWSCNVDILQNGPRILDFLPADDAQEPVDLQQCSSFLPLGVHVDMAQRRLFYWQSTTEDLEIVKAAWPGWQVETWQDRYECHLALLGDLVKPFEPDTATLLRQVEELVCRDYGSPIPAIEGAASQLEQTGRTVAINPDVYIGVLPYEIPLAERRTLLHRAIAQALNAST